MADEKKTAPTDPKKESEQDRRGISASKTVEPNAPDVSTTEAENVKVIVPPGTVPSSMQAGPSAPHPASDRPDLVIGSPEVEEAKARALVAEAARLPEAEIAIASNKGKAVGEPIQCIAKRKFFDERGATIKPGAVYYYQPREGKTFPWTVLEPVNKSQASAAKKEWEKSREEKQAVADEKSRRREALAELARERL